MNTFKQLECAFHAKELVRYGRCPSSWLNQYVTIPTDWLDAPLASKAHKLKEVKAKVKRILGEEGRECLFEFDPGIIKGHAGDMDDGADTRWFIVVTTFNSMLDGHAIARIRR